MLKHQEPRAFAVRVALDLAKDRQREQDTSLPEALDAVLSEQPELYSESLGEFVPTTPEQYAEKKLWWR